MGIMNKSQRESALHTNLEALCWAMENMLHHSTCQQFRTDCKNLIEMLREPYACPNFYTELEELQELKRRFQDFRISYTTR